MTTRRPQGGDDVHRLQRRVERVLGKMEGVQSFENLETQKVTVVGTVTMEEVVLLAKTGKAVEPWSD